MTMTGWLMVGSVGVAALLGLAGCSGEDAQATDAVGAEETVLDAVVVDTVADVLETVIDVMIDEGIQDKTQGDDEDGSEDEWADAAQDEVMTDGVLQEVEAPGEEVLEVLPDGFALEFSRTPEGDPVSDDQMRDFTCKVTRLWKEKDLFRWALDTNWASDPITGRREFKTWWTGNEALKTGVRVTFRPSLWGGPDNTMIPHSRVLAGAAAGYLLTGDAAAGEVARTFALGESATMLGMVWNAQDAVRSIMARAVVPPNQVVSLPGAREAATDFGRWRQASCAWNTCWIEVEDNPYWGDIWVKNKRSKDDVPHIYRAAVWLRFLSERAEDQGIREAATEAWHLLQGFAQDIVDHGYAIRTKDDQGQIFTPNQDLANFTMYMALDPLAECPARLSTALLATGTRLGIDCGTGYLGPYEEFSFLANYYNLHILRGFHGAALLLALSSGRNEAALALLGGMADRADADFDRDISKFDVTRETWEEDLAVDLLLGAAVGLPLKWKEVRLIQQYYAASIDQLLVWPYWNLWDPAIMDGVYPHRPSTGIDVSDMFFFLEYCYSPFRNPSGAVPVDCEIVSDVTRWGCLEPSSRTGVATN